jgi:hypothetical protein
VACLFSRYETGNKAMHHNNPDLIDRVWLGRALTFHGINEDDLAMAVSAMSESWRAEIAVRLGKLAADLHDLAMVAAEAERRFLNATTACRRG